MPSTGVAPIAIHITDPEGRLITERTATTNTGRVSYETRHSATKTGQYKIQAFVLGGTLAGKAESEIHEVLVQ